MNKFLLVAVTTLVGLFFFGVSVGVAAEDFPLIPSPQKITLKGGKVTLTAAATVWQFTDTDAARAEFVKNSWHEFLQKNGVQNGDGYLFNFIVTPDAKIAAIKEPYQKMHAEEKYTITIGEKEATITAPSIRGIFYAIETIKQLSTKIENNFALPHCEIEDYPAFAMRGFLIDIGRNYAPMAMLKTIIDFMAQYKYNVFHFHCTEDPGWRLESKIYPQLNSAASMTRMPGKFYSQDEFKAIVEYCRLRNIMVIPELDMPGHTAAFRRALGFEKMQDEKVTKILTELIAELCTLVPAEIMPYLHIGTDEVEEYEMVDEATLQKYYDAVDKENRRAIVWDPGLEVKSYTRSIPQMWRTRQQSLPAKNREFIDSQENYANLLDPFQAAIMYYFRKNCAQGIKNGAIPVGGILCSWPDVELVKPENHFLQTHIFSSMIFYAESIWRNPHLEDREQFYVNLPLLGDQQLAEYQIFEAKVLAHKERYCQNLPFPYFKQTDLFWKVIGPFPHHGDVKKSFPVENSITQNYTVENKTYEWFKKPYIGATIIYSYNHYANFPTMLVGDKINGVTPKDSTMYALTYFYAENDETAPVWISGYNHPNANRGKDIACVEGLWANAEPQFWINGEIIPAPNWQEKNRQGQDPYLDENYYWRAPTMLKFKKGWNKVLIKSPCDKTNINRWQFTFVPITAPRESFAIGVERAKNIRAATPDEIDELMKE